MLERTLYCLFYMKELGQQLEEYVIICVLWYFSLLHSLCLDQSMFETLRVKTFLQSEDIFTVAYFLKRLLKVAQ